MDQNVSEILAKLYYDVKNPASFAGVLKLFKYAKKLIKRLKVNDVERWLLTQNVYTLFRRSKKNFNRLYTITNQIDKQWQADLLDIQMFSKYNDGVKYLSVCIDILSRYGFAVPLKIKSSESIIEGFK